MILELALLSAAAFGISDFLAGLASRRLNAYVVSVIGQAVSIIITVIVMIVTEKTLPTSSAVFWGAASGIGSAIGIFCLYAGYAKHELSVVGPISSLIASCIPVAVGIILGDKLGPLSIAGVLIAFPAIWLASSGSGKLSLKSLKGTGASYGVWAGVGFALIFIALNRAGSNSGLWPVAISQGSALLILIIFTMVAHVPTKFSLKSTAAAIFGGAFGGLATIAYFFATQAGQLSIVSLLSSFYPAITVVLAVIVLHEKVTGKRLVGLILAALAIVAIVYA